MNDSSVKKCLYCYQTITGEETCYHSKCAKKIFGTSKAPILPYTRDNIEELALHILEFWGTIRLYCFADAYMFDLWGNFLCLRKIG